MKRYVWLLLLGIMLLPACATKPTDPAQLKAYEEANDPLEPMNRFVFGFNMGTDKFVIKPVAKGYRFVTPTQLQTGLFNFFNNMRQPVYILNAALQGEGEQAAQTTRRFFTNTFFGFFGFNDTASEIGVPVYTNDFGQTLYVWGVKEGGPYLVLPILGPSNPRDAVGLGVDAFANPIDWGLAEEPILLYARAGMDGLTRRAASLDFLDSLQNSSTDFYATVRSMYRQNRQKELSDTQKVQTDGPKDYEFDFPTDDE